MSKYDELDVVLRNIKNIEDWIALAYICGCEDIETNLTLTNFMTKIKNIESLSKYTNEAIDQEVLSKIFNKEIRSNFGNTFVNILRDEYTPDYSVILKNTAKEIGVKYIPSMQVLSINDVEYLEREIFTAVLQNIKKSIIEKQGISRWENIELNTKNNLLQTFEKGKITKEEYDELKININNTDIISLIETAKISGFLIYVLEKAISTVINKELGLDEKKVKVQFFDPMVMISTCIYVPPTPFLVQALQAAWAVLISDIKKRRTLGTILFITALRQRQKYETRLL